MLFFGTYFIIRSHMFQSTSYTVSIIRAQRVNTKRHERRWPYLVSAFCLSTSICWHDSSRKAIVAILLLLTTFGVGLRCFADFGKGLYASKTSGQLLPRCWSPYLSLRHNTEHVLRYPPPIKENTRWRWREARFPWLPTGTTIVDWVISMISDCDSARHARTFMYDLFYV